MGCKKMAVDKTKNTQILVTFPNDMVEKIEEFQFENRYKNRNEAIRALVKKSLDNDEKKDQSSV